MVKEEFKFLEKKIDLENREELGSSYKIKSYEDNLKLMKSKNLPQKSIEDVLNHFFLENNDITKKTKDSISTVVYSQKDRIIVIITNSGQDIIWKRDKLIHAYGWFFFVSKPKQKPNKQKKEKKKQEPKKEEKTLSREAFLFGEISIPLKEKENMRSLYHNKEYFQYLKLINSNKIPQLPIKDVLNDLLFKNEVIPLKEKKSIGKIIYYQKERVIVVKSLIGDMMYEQLKGLVKKYGWYFYITGVPVGESNISEAIDKIDKKFDSNYFKEVLVSNSDTKEKTRITIYPIVLKPNHNCHILGIGNLNILLDCGISEPEDDEKLYEKESTEEVEQLENREITEDVKVFNKEKEYRSLDNFKHIEEYLQNLPQLIVAAEQEESIPENDLQIQSFMPKIDAVFISHSHFDHVSGLRKLISQNPDVPVFCSRITLDLFLLRDSNYLKQES
ncbi:MAG: MBL fold metallo-hydrolase, partial [Candidatus Lokiarchaeota archaeon]|nr:MBL fold metallo-hydrolase [Candidatus Lokiarchaeota archaeon]